MGLECDHVTDGYKNKQIVSLKMAYFKSKHVRQCKQQNNTTYTRQSENVIVSCQV